MESIKNEFLEWARKEGSELGEGEYDQRISKVGEATQELPVQEMILHLQTFRFGFSFFYGEKSKDEMVPIAWADGIILKWQKEHDEKPVWPIKDPETNTYFIPKVTVNRMSPPTGSTPTEQYLRDLLKASQRRFPDKNSTRILEALTPYAKQLKEQDIRTFMRIADCFPGYSDGIN